MGTILGISIFILIVSLVDYFLTKEKVKEKKKERESKEGAEDKKEEKPKPGVPTIFLLIIVLGIFFGGIYLCFPRLSHYLWKASWTGATIILCLVALFIIGKQAGTAVGWARFVIISLMIAAVIAMGVQAGRERKSMGISTTHCYTYPCGAQAYSPVSSQENVPSGWPVPTRGITSGFGPRKHPATGKISPHRGVDLKASMGTPVKATADGGIKFAGWLNGTSGYVVTIDHGNGYETHYYHLSKTKVRKGQKVRKGEMIALSGKTGRCTGPHLFYAVHLNGKPVDPEPFLSGAVTGEALVKKNEDGSWIVIVPATQRWISTGIKVNSGDAIDISASGNWVYWPGHSIVDANGDPRDVTCDTDGYNGGQLLIKIGDRIYPGSTSMKIVAMESCDNLLLGIMDKKIHDNRGFLNVTIRFRA